MKTVKNITLRQPASPTPSAPSVSAEEILMAKVKEYNKTVNELSKFQLSKREVQMFCSAILEYAKQVSGNEWIRVEDGLPETEEEVIVFAKREFEDDSEVFYGCYNAKSNWWYSPVMREDEALDVTHWQPLPKKPI